METSAKRWRNFSVLFYNTKVVVPWSTLTMTNTTHWCTVEGPKCFSPSLRSVPRRACAQLRPLLVPLKCELTCLAAVVVQLNLLEDQRKRILSQCAFTIQCCWQRYRCRRRRCRQRSATLIQAGNLISASSGSAEQHYWMCVALFPFSVCWFWPRCLANRKQLAERVCICSDVTNPWTLSDYLLV